MRERPLTVMENVEPRLADFPGRLLRIVCHPFNAEAACRPVCVSDMGCCGHYGWLIRLMCLITNARK